MLIKFIEKKLRLTYTGIGSLPFKDKNAPNESINYVFDYCDNFPYWAQLPHFKKRRKIWHTSLPKIFRLTL